VGDRERLVQLQLVQLGVQYMRGFFCAEAFVLDNFLDGGVHDR